MGSVPNQATSISSQPTAFSVAIIGGGIGGLTLAIGLLKHPHIDVQVYEAAPSFGEIGAGVGKLCHRRFVIFRGAHCRILQHSAPMRRERWNLSATGLTLLFKGTRQETSGLLMLITLRNIES